jgi:hypothetical protein
MMQGRSNGRGYPDRSAKRCLLRHRRGLYPLIREATLECRRPGESGLVNLGWKDARHVGAGFRPLRK